MTTALPSLMQNYGRQNIAFVRGEGVYLWDTAGAKYLDAFAGVAVSTLGHAHPALVQAVTHQVQTVVHTSNHYHIPEQEALADLIVANTFPGQMLFCNSGAEANEVAYKLMRLWGNVAHNGTKKRILAFDGGFHGRTIGALAMTANPAYRSAFEPMPVVEFLPYGDVAALNNAMRDDVAGIIIEPIQGEAGVIVPPAGFLAAVRTACDRHHALMVCDEVQTGIGRTGKLFGFQHEGIQPDIITLAKGLGGGVPIGAALAVPAVAALLKPGLHGTTYGGNHLACAAGLAVLKTVLTPGFLDQVIQVSAHLQAGLKHIFPTAVVRGRGLLLGVVLPADHPVANVVTAARAKGLIVGPSGNNTLRIAPPLILTMAQADELLTALAAAVKAG